MAEMRVVRKDDEQAEKRVTGATGGATPSNSVPAEGDVKSASKQGRAKIRQHLHRMVWPFFGVIGSERLFDAAENNPDLADAATAAFAATLVIFSIFLYRWWQDASQRRLALGLPSSRPLAPPWAVWVLRDRDAEQPLRLLQAEGYWLSWFLLVWIGWTLNLCYLVVKTVAGWDQGSIAMATEFMFDIFFIYIVVDGLAFFHAYRKRKS